MHDLTISQLARAASVRVETIRYYERLGLLRQPQRSENGYRQYTTGDAAQLQFIRNTQALGFTLKEIKQLINARQDNNACCTAVRAMTTNKLADIRQKLHKLKTIESRLRYFCDSCSEPHNSISCPLINALWSQGKESKIILPGLSD